MKPVSMSTDMMYWGTSGTQTLVGEFCCFEAEKTQWKVPGNLRSRQFPFRLIPEYGNFKSEAGGRLMLKSVLLL